MLFLWRVEEISNQLVAIMPSEGNLIGIFGWFLGQNNTYWTAKLKKMFASKYLDLCVSSTSVCVWVTFKKLIFFLKIFCHMGPLLPLFWTSGNICPRFQSQSGQPYSHLTKAYAINELWFVMIVTFLWGMLCFLWVIHIFNSDKVLDHMTRNKKCVLQSKM